MEDHSTSVEGATARFLCIAQWNDRTLANVAFLICAGAVLLSSLSVSAQTGRPNPPAAQLPLGVGGLWYDDTDQGAVELVQCGERLCGNIVWLRLPVDHTGRPLTDALNTDARKRKRPICGLPVIGDLKRQPGGSWDEGWIYDPKQGRQFDVALRLQSADRLQVTGYLGIKLISETFVWRRAPADLKRCG